MGMGAFSNTLVSLPLKKKEIWNNNCRKKYKTSSSTFLRPRSKDVTFQTYNGQLDLCNWFQAPKWSLDWCFLHNCPLGHMSNTFEPETTSSGWWNGEAGHGQRRVHCSKEKGKVPRVQNPLACPGSLGGPKMIPLAPLNVERHFFSLFGDQRHTRPWRIIHDVRKRVINKGLPY